MSNLPFRPMRSNQASHQTQSEDKGKSIEEIEEPSTQPAFQRKQSNSTQKKQSILPEWDLLPPRSIMRRKGI